MATPTIRPARPDDAPFIAALVNLHIRTTTANWHEVERTAEDRAAWIRDLPPQHAIIVCEVAGEPAGYASFSTFRAWSAYDRTVENAIYIDGRFHRHGLGRVLLGELINLARARGHHAMVAAISADQEPSLALHRACGFTECGRLPQVGRKFGLWLDLVLMHRLLG